ncbi:MAG: hypothetical protein ACI9O4_001023 [Chitinophagales bacterium]|jgi:hypothetical protein
MKRNFTLIPHLFSARIIYLCVIKTIPLIILVFLGLYLFSCVPYEEYSAWNKFPIDQNALANLTEIELLYASASADDQEHL